MDKKNKGFWADNAATGRVSAIDSTAGLKRAKTFFEAEFADYAVANPEFCKLASDLMKNHYWNSNIFKEKTLLADATYSRIINNEMKSPSFHTVMSLCVGLGLSLRNAERLLGSAGHTFGATREYQAYRHVLETMSGHCIDECNDFLEYIGVPPLGSRPRIIRRVSVK